MRYLYGSRVPLFRFQWGLLLPGLPRAWIRRSRAFSGPGDASPCLPLAPP
jgi:hypothetical protein